MAIHIAIFSALIYGAHVTIRDTSPPLVGKAESALAIRRDRDTVGTWQGVLSRASRPSLVVVRITDARVRCSAETWGLAEDQLEHSKANGQVTLNDTVLRIRIPALQGQFQGNVAKNGTVIRGTWTTPMLGTRPLELRRADSESALRDLAMCR